MNANKSRAPIDVALGTAKNLHVDITLISEPNNAHIVKKQNG